MLRRFLTSRQDELLRRERELLIALQTALHRFGAEEADLETLYQAQRQLDELFLLVVVGEFNSGKSAFINALLGEPFLTEGVTPTTAHIYLLRHGQANRQISPDGIILLFHPAEWLQDINLVDTPGTNAIIQRHQQLTEAFIPRSDLVLFVTSADRPFSESERAFLDLIRDWGKKVVMIINKIDILESPEEVEQVVAFVRENAQRLLGLYPEVFPISARLALRAKTLAAGPERETLWERSRFAALEAYILNVLDERERIRLKLFNPLGVAQRLAAKYLAQVHDRQRLLREDTATTEAIEAELTAYEADMRRDFRYHLSHVDNVLHEMTLRGLAFFDETVRLGRLLDLLNAERLRGEFERIVIADSVVQVEAHVNELINWMVDQDFRQWQAVTEYLNRRVAQHQERIIGRVGGAFENHRRELLASVGRVASEIVRSYDHRRQAREIATSVQAAVAQTALVEVGAVGLGALLVKLLATTLADVTGLLAAGVLAALGLYVLPMRRHKAKADLQARVDELRQRLADTLTHQFEDELTRSLARIRDAISPYTRFVRSEQAKLEQIEHNLKAIEAELQHLRLAICELA
ncbi:MAG: dynamin family protein [Anaerolineae bacterium]|nr:dynamin family protein [Anaerolineae bacterium]MDW8099193.1 dynamin family protein [Anaerolineae bacterium]